MKGKKERMFLVTRPESPYECVRLSVDVCYPYDEPDMTDGQKRTIDALLRDNMHPDTLRRMTRPDVFAGEYFDEHMHVDWIREAGKTWFVDYVQRAVDRMGRIPDDGAA